VKERKLTYFIPPLQPKRGVYGGSHGIPVVQKGQSHADIQVFKVRGEQQYPRPQKKSRRKCIMFSL